MLKRLRGGSRGQARSAPLGQVVLPILTTCLLLWPAHAQPRAYAGGDYWLRNEHTWTDWEVVSSELAGRLTPDWPLDDQEPGALLSIDWRVKSWPVVYKFTKGERVQALPDAVGGIIIKDIDGASWMRVALPDGQFCFVRANSRYMRPVEPSPQASGI